jgi:hypothetical protein
MLFVQSTAKSRVNKKTCSLQPSGERVAGVVPGVPVPQPVVDDARPDGFVVAFSQVIKQLRGEAGVVASAGGFYGLVCLAQDGDNVAGPGLQAARAELRYGAAAADHVRGALLDAGQPSQQVLVSGVAVGYQRPAEQARKPRGNGGLAP